MPTDISGEIEGKNASKNNPLPVRLQNNLAFRQDFDGGNQPVYVGEAEPGTLTSAPSWRIKKMTYTSLKLTSITWVDNGKFTQIYDNRATLTYA